jgi:hypothetical protein
MAAKRDRLAAQMREAVTAGEWVAIGPATVRWSLTGRPTPDWVTSRQWPAPTFDAHVFLTLIGSKVIMRVDRAPWLEARDAHVSMNRAFEVLENPAELLG